jgi:hypothetical protein
MADIDQRAPHEGYLKAHLNGNLSLTKSFWLNLFAVNLAALILQLIVSGSTLAPIIFVGSFFIWIWSAVGVWRSADRYSKSPQSGIWGNVASAIVVIQGVSWLTSAPSLFS